MSSVKTKMIFGFESLAAPKTTFVRPTDSATTDAIKTIREKTEGTRIIEKTGDKNSKTAIAKNNAILRHFGHSTYSSRIVSQTKFPFTYKSHRA